MKIIIESLIRKIKKRKFQFDKDISVGDIFRLVMVNGIALMRGAVFYRKVLALGKGVEIYRINNCEIGKGVSIASYSILDFLGREQSRIGNGSSVGRFSLIKVSGSFSDLGKQIDIGNNVGLGDFSHIGGAGGVKIGDDTIVGAYFSVHPENHIFISNEKLIRQQGVTHKGIVIGKNCWIGAKVTVLDGTNVGDGCVIAAGAVLTGKSFPDNSIIAGVPAKIIGSRNE